MGTTNIAALRLEILEGDTTELTSSATRGIIPALVPVKMDLQVVTHPTDGVLSYLLLQLLKTTDKGLMMRALASATAHVLGHKSNMTGSARIPEAITGLDGLGDENIPDDTTLKTNFVDAEEVTKGELMQVAVADADELGAFFGLMFVAGNKRITEENRTAFNERRQSAATSGIIGDAVIFTNNSPYLPDALMKNMNAAFTSLGDIRAQLTLAVIAHLPECRMGPAQAFSNLFMLLVDFGMGGLRAIRLNLGRHAWMRSAFPELLPELHAANTAFKLIGKAAPEQRSFLKAIHGNHFVPVNLRQINNLVGVCREVEAVDNPSFANYRGGTITDQQRAIVEKHTAPPLGRTEDDRD